MDKKSRIRSGLFFGIVMSVFYILQNLLTHDNPTTKNIIVFIFSGLTGGAIAGALFGWLIGLFANSKSVKQATKINLGTDETVLFETGANHFKGAEAVGGKLYLTNKRLVFKSHKFNIQNHELSIDVVCISGICRYRTLGIVNNGLSVTTTGNKVEKFVVQKPEKWVAMMTNDDDLQLSN